MKIQKRCQYLQSKSCFQFLSHDFQKVIFGSKVLKGPYHIGAHDATTLKADFSPKGRDTRWRIFLLTAQLRASLGPTPLLIRAELENVGKIIRFWLQTFCFSSGFLKTLSRNYL